MMHDRTRTADVQALPASIPDRMSDRWRARDDARAQRLSIAVVVALLALFVAAPTVLLLVRSVGNDDGAWVGLANFARYLSTPRLLESLWDTAVVVSVSSVVSVTLAFVYAFALTHSRMPLRRVLRVVALLPLYAPTMLLAMGLVYLFGNQGLLTHGLFGRLPFALDIGLYGPVGITMALVPAIFPAAVLVLEAALRGADGRLYEAAATMGASRTRTFLAVTLPSARFGLVSACSVAVILAVTDFGAPKIVGGRTTVLAVSVYQQVVGQHDLSMGATVSVLLLAPTVLAFAADRLVRRRQAAALGSRATPYVPPVNRARDALLLAFCGVVALGVLAVVVTPLAVALVDQWPWSLTGEAAGPVFSLRHFRFREGAAATYGAGEAFFNSVRMAAYTAAAGTVLAFAAAYLFEKLRPLPWARRAGYFLAVLPLGLPGLSLGLAYVLLFGRGEMGGLRSPVAWLYGTMGLLVACNVVHFFGVSFLTATTALRRLDAEFEQAAATLGAPAWRLCASVTVPWCAPALVEIAVYQFVSAMTTVSAVIFLYPGDLPLASVAVVNLDEAGLTQSGAAMCALILLTNLAARAAAEVVAARTARRSRRWRGA
jgi:iron(III) transport system permease protein